MKRKYYKYKYGLLHFQGEIVGVKNLDRLFRKNSKTSMQTEIAIAIMKMRKDKKVRMI